MRAWVCVCDPDVTLRVLLARAFAVLSLSFVAGQSLPPAGRPCASPAVIAPTVASGHPDTTTCRQPGCSRRGLAGKIWQGVRLLVSHCIVHS